MTDELPYTSRPEDVTRLLRELPAVNVPQGKVEASFLKSAGFSTTSAKHLLGILKRLGFIDEKNEASGIWLSYAGDENRGLVLAAAMKKAYSALFKAILCPYLEDDEVLLDFFKRNVKASPREMEQILQTFRNLAELADFQDLLGEEGDDEAEPAGESSALNLKVNPNLQINLQVHIDPNTPDEKIETIFKNMRRYLLGKGE